MESGSGRRTLRNEVSGLMWILGPGQHVSNKWRLAGEVRQAGQAPRGRGLRRGGVVCGLIRRALAHQHRVADFWAVVGCVGCGLWVWASGCPGAVDLWLKGIKGIFYGFAHGLMASLVAQFRVRAALRWRPGG